jgi:16S rRNA C1402 (ribose-2'-O) methylase RsmI
MIDSMKEQMLNIVSTKIDNIEDHEDYVISMIGSRAIATLLKGTMEDILKNERTRDHIFNHLTIHCAIFATLSHIEYSTKEDMLEQAKTLISKL